MRVSVVATAVDSPPHGGRLRNVCALEPSFAWTQVPRGAWKTGAGRVRKWSSSTKRDLSPFPYNKHNRPKYTAIPSSPFSLPLNVRLGSVTHWFLWHLNRGETYINVCKQHCTMSILFHNASEGKANMSEVSALIL